MTKNVPVSVKKDGNRDEKRNFLFAAACIFRFRMIR